jgi:ATP adenylyltransferase
MSGLDHLWAGWRTEYITSTTDAGPIGPAGVGSEAPPVLDRAVEANRVVEAERAAERDRCVFCRILASGLPDDETNIVWRDRSGLVVALLNAYPYSTGHVMVMPVRHVGELETLEGDEAATLWAGVTAAVGAQKRAYWPEGLNVGVNLGRAAGAGVPGHLHVHVLPRWLGDSNFMTSVADTRVLPEALSVSAAKLRDAWAR